MVPEECSASVCSRRTMMALPLCEAFQVPSNRWDEVGAAQKECAEATAVAAIRQKSTTSCEYVRALRRMEVDICIVLLRTFACKQTSNATLGVASFGQLDSREAVKDGLRQGGDF